MSEPPDIRAAIIAPMSDAELAANGADILRRLAGLGPGHVRDLLAGAWQELAAEVAARERGGLAVKSPGMGVLVAEADITE